MLAGQCTPMGSLIPVDGSRGEGRGGEEEVVRGGERRRERVKRKEEQEAQYLHKKKF